MGGEAEGWRIDHVEFDYLDVTATSPGCGISASGVGVIDHCRFENVYTAVAAFGTGDASWEQPLALGSCDAVYIGDNEMNNTEIVGDGATDAYGGARYVFRTALEPVTMVWIRGAIVPPIVSRSTTSSPWGCSDPAMADHIQEDRDFYNDTHRGRATHLVPTLIP